MLGDSTLRMHAGAPEDDPRDSPGRASASTLRMRDSSTVWVNSFGASSTAVSSNRPTGLVRFSMAFCCGERLVASRSRI